MVDASVYVKVLKEILAELDRQDVNFKLENNRIQAAIAILHEMARDRREAK